MGNPFAATAEKDWVKKEAPAPPPARGSSSTPKPQPPPPSSGPNSAMTSPTSPEISPGLRRTGTNSSASSSSRAPSVRKLPPPYDPASLPSLGSQILLPPPPPLAPLQRQRNGREMTSPPFQPPSRSPATTSITGPSTPPFTAPTTIATSRPPALQPHNTSSSIETSGKPPPPRPKKPQSLAGSTVETSPQSFKSAIEGIDDEPISSVASRIRGMEMGGNADNNSPAPMKRTVSNPVGGSNISSISSSIGVIGGVRSVSSTGRRNGVSDEVDDRPPLPQRRNTPGNLMDEGSGDGVSGWKPLTPGK
ncbi:hypothetical protein AA313_de0205438 [Arthrobotrys entomopaga]|nr:hypothetical protein AA313_de0205438 [Arthrobotrys entomopaga]